MCKGDPCRLQTPRNTQKLKDQAALQVEVSGGLEKRELMQPSPCPTHPGPTPFPVRQKPGVLLSGETDPRQLPTPKCQAQVGAEVWPQTEMRLSEIGMPYPCSNPLSHVGSQNAGFQAYIPQAGTRKRPIIPNFGDFLEEQ